MKKIVMMLSVLSSAHNTFCMQSNSSSTGTLGRAATTVFDKWNPTGILDELRKNGVNKDLREQMRQMHRLDRIIPTHIGNKEPGKLCDDLAIILSSNYPLSTNARTMAHDYLKKLRPSIRADKPMLNRVTTTLDLLDPAQIINDLQEGGINLEEQIDLENRINRALDKLVILRNTDALNQLIGIIATTRDKHGAPAIIPGKRVLKIAHDYLQAQARENDEKKKMIHDAFGTKKNDAEPEKK